jgi:hypothetical protein
MKKQMKKLVLAKETVALITLSQVAGGGPTALCTPSWNCPTFACQSGKYPC